MEEKYKENAFFGGIGKEDLDQLDLPIRECVVEEGQVLFEEDSKARDLYLIVSGSIEISKKGRGGKQEVLAIKGPNEFFGETALLQTGEQLRTARATAKSSTVLGNLDEVGLYLMLAHSPDVAIHFAQMIATELKSANTRFINKLIDSERLSLIGTMMGAMVHDFRNPISTIMLASEYMKSNSEVEQMVTMGELTGEAADQMQVMIQEVLDYSKGETNLKLNPVGVPDLLEAIGNQALNKLEEQGITVVREIDFDGEIVVDRNRMIRLLNNIIKNSTDAMKKGGTLTLRIHKENGRVRIEIEDTGCGIPQEILPRIFEPFVTHGKSNGTGLGMAIVKSVVLAHKGSIEIESEVGSGTTCLIDLPLTQ
ncbi:ATP-binding protein [Verrucomicrobiales bacterium]|nr:ATP-binding protein [Verrucomicrobiales bacterium]MDA7926442.1 ATP-binding protein [Verrucomicrobiales bacterium]